MVDPKRAGQTRTKGYVKAAVAGATALALAIAPVTSRVDRLVVEAVAQVGHKGILHAYQKRAIQASHQHELVVIEKSRRIGLTWAFASDDVVTAASSRGAGGDDVMYISYSFDMAREYIDACAGFARAFMGIDAQVGETIFRDEDPSKPGESRDIKAFRIDFGSGFCIQALTSAPRSLRGKQGKVRIDEAAFVDNLKELLKAALALIMLGGSVVVISTHDGVDNEFNKLIQEIRKGEREGAVVTITFADALADGFYERIAMLRSLDPSEEAKAAWVAKIRKTYGQAVEEELDCIPSRSSGSWLSYDQVERAERAGIPVLRLSFADAFAFKPDHIREAEIRDWCRQHLAPLLEGLSTVKTYGLGGDYARSSDLSVIWALEEQQDRSVKTPFVVEMRNVPFAEQLFVWRFILERIRRWRAKVDAQGNGSALAERLVQIFGQSRVEAVKATADWWRDEGPPLKGKFEDGKIEVPQDADISSDLRQVRVEKGAPSIPEKRTTGKGEDKQKDVSNKRHADAAVALFHAHAAIREGGVWSADFRSTPSENPAESHATDAGFGAMSSEIDLGGF